jgi:hypothetical protein
MFDNFLINLDYMNKKKRNIFIYIYIKKKL